MTTFFLYFSFLQQCCYLQRARVTSIDIDKLILISIFIHISTKYLVLAKYNYTVMISIYNKIISISLHT